MFIDLEYSEYLNKYSLVLDIDTDGWKSNLIIEYSYVDRNLTNAIYWRIKDTPYIFNIKLNELNRLYRGNVYNYFREELNIIRNTILSTIVNEQKTPDEVSLIAHYKQLLIL
jgi:hypothetical protein